MAKEGSLSDSATPALARGNVAGALFNCTLSSLIGVLLVPPLCVIFLGAGSAGGAGALGEMFGRIALTILLPLVLGQLARRWLNAPFARHPAAVRRTNAGVILFIVWSAFCESFTRGVWREVGWADLGMTVGLPPSWRRPAAGCGGSPRAWPCPTNPGSPPFSAAPRSPSPSACRSRR